MEVKRKNYHCVLELSTVLIIAIGRIITSESSGGLLGIQQCRVNKLYLLQNVSAYFTIQLALVIHEKICCNLSLIILNLGIKLIFCCHETSENRLLMKGTRQSAVISFQTNSNFKFLYQQRLGKLSVNP